MKRANVSILLHVPYIKTLIVDVSVDDKIAVLNKYFGYTSVTFLHRGQILNSNCSFLFYNVKKCDLIIAVAEENNAKTEQWLRLTNDDTYLANVLTSMRNTKWFRSHIMIQDMVLMKMEMNPKKYWKVVANYIRKTSLGACSCDKGSLIPNKPEAIPEDPLPLL